MSKRNPWDEVAQVYDEVRPSYPDQLIQDIIERAKLSSSSRLLEIAAGTGKATVQFLEKGFQVHCVEPGPNLADILVRKCSFHPNFSADVASFEEWTPDESIKYDLVFCAQAFEYLDPEIRYKKCHDLLKEGGYLAFFWYGHDNEPWASDITASGLFQKPEIFEYHTELKSSVEDCIKALESTSAFVVLDEENKAKMRDETRRNIEQQGGFMSVMFNYQMYLAKKI